MRTVLQLKGDMYTFSFVWNPTAFSLLYAFRGRKRRRFRFDKAGVSAMSPANYHYTLAGLETIKHFFS